MKKSVISRDLYYYKAVQKFPAVRDLITEGAACTILYQGTIEMSFV